MLILGFAAMMGWLAYHGRFVFAAIISVIFLATIAMVIKTIALSLMAWYLAGKSGGSFGNPLSTILKIAGLVVALDAAILWTWTAMVAVGAITNRFYVGKTLLVLFLVTLVAAAVISQFVYGLHGDEANLFSRFVAGGNLAINVLLILVLWMIARSAATAARQARASSTASFSTSGVPPATTSPSSPVVIETLQDRDVESRLRKRSIAIMEGNEWKTSPRFHPSAS